ncbi:MAG: heparan-alpha-glucosaminide N-acetyltransferase domain-containing protein [Candidatus Thorarchaeota archaeon]
MELQRIKSIDIFRGLCMTWMVLNHLIDWWLLSSSSWLHNVTIMILDPIGASGFLFISGVSISMSYRRRQIKARTSKDMNMRIVKSSYFFRSLFLFMIAISYNIPIAIVLNNPSYIWTWFVLLTAAVSMFMVWPFLYTSKIVRVSAGFFIIVANQAILNFLSAFQGEFNIFGILYHMLYNNIYQDPILTFFPFFLLGTVFGDMLFDSYLNNSSINKKVVLKRRLLIPAILVGISLILIGILIKFPEFLTRQRFSWIIYSLGIETLLLSILLLFEKFIMIDIKKSYKLLFYYSYYSLTVYLGHYLLYFLFLSRLNPYNIWFFILATFILIGILLRFIYKKFEYKASVKIQISRLSLNLTLKIEEKKLSKIKK